MHHGMMPYGKVCKIWSSLQFPLAFLLGCYYYWSLGYLRHDAREMKHFSCYVWQVTVQEDKEWLNHSDFMGETGGKGCYKSQKDSNQYSTDPHYKEVSNPSEYVNNLNCAHLAERLEQIVQDLWGKRKHIMFLNSSSFPFVSLCSPASMLNFEFLCLPWTHIRDMLLFTSGILLVIHKYQGDIQRRVNTTISIFANGIGYLTHAILQVRSRDLSNLSSNSFICRASNFSTNGHFRFSPETKTLKKRRKKYGFIITEKSHYFQMCLIYIRHQKLQYWIGP